MSPRTPHERSRRPIRQRRPRPDGAPGLGRSTDGDRFASHSRAIEDRRAERRTALLDAAVEAIRTHGDGVSMDELAAAGGVTKPILYRHFGDRRGLVAALAERFSTDLMEALRTALGRPAGSLREVIASTIDAFVGFIEDDPDVYRFLVQRLAGDTPDTAAALGGFLRRVGGEVAVVLGEELRDAGRDSGAAEPLAHGIVGMVHAAGDWWLERRNMPRPRLVAYLTEFVWHGLVGMGVDPAYQADRGTLDAGATTTTEETS